MSNKQNNIEQQFEINTTNVGPLDNKSFTLSVSKDKIPNKFCIYGNNGSGKTFLSRCFSLQLLDKEKDNDETRKELISLSKKLIKVDEDSFEFEFCFSNKKIKITANKRDSLPDITDNSDFIFYVFNEDFIHKHTLEIENPDSNIPGYIVIGKESIEIYKKQKILNCLKKDKENLESILTNKIKEYAKELSRKFDISKNLTEYKNLFSYDSLIKEHKVENVDSLYYYEEKYNEFKDLKSDDISLDKDVGIFDTNIKLDHIKNDLSQEYSLDEFNEEFKSEIKNNFKFFETGINLSNKKNCPFCKQEYSKEAINLINKYTNFIKGKQGEIISNLNTYIEHLDSIFNKYMTFKVNADKIITNESSIKNYFESLKSDDFKSFPETKKLDQIIENFKTRITKKLTNINIKIDASTEINYLNEFFKSTEEVITKNNELIRKINKLYENKDNEKKSIQKNICKSGFNELLELTKEELKKLKQKNTEISQIEDEINKIKSSNKESRKVIIIEKLKELLSYFFGDKYQFDEEESKFIFKKHIVEESNYVFSTAERNIIAFCFFISYIFKKIEEKNELKKVFWIIDDPISSMDYDFIFSIANVIEKYCYKFTFKKEIYNNSIILLTHNYQFFNLLKGNFKYHGISLNNGIFNENKNYLLPYSSHILDIYNISEGKSQPNHTTLNSIRQIIETICKFEYPNLEHLQDFDPIKNIFEDYNTILKIINYGSHGYFIDEPIIDDKTKIQCCTELICYIKNKYPGQVGWIEKRFKK